MSLLVVLLVSLQGLWLVDGGATYKNSNAPIKYPGPIKERTSAFMPTINDIPKRCRGQTYCTERAANYPEEHFNKMYKGYKPVSFPSVVTADPLNRQGDPDDNDDCVSEVKFEPLYHVQSETGEWRTVAQAPGADYVQRVRLETCSNPGGSCFTKYLPVSGYQTYCNQTYNTWEVTVSTADQGTEKIKVKLPVCCSCHYRTLDD